ncbi:Imm32 family immunity protein [Mucilaginibacter ginsenosidivorans]|uniref:Uncharacterized protein n=1 Tax=Mucilaginibacter ginsenosidivorans TaxID=398053 RepID=A0A5B8V0I3_9SPHI|nr:hypothetical protein [Mucilaginibacter ginsenosidivorans]QEC64313.1 hypothetical protein FRZ54_17600 [Mucilaginibacter ginsenosidivorans]
MAKIKWKGFEIEGHLDIFVADYEDEFKGEIEKWQNVLIYGDPGGLRSFARLLMKIADLNQENEAGLPIGAREHYELRPNLELSKSSVQTILGRIDAKGTGRFYDRFVAKDEKKKSQV